MKPHWQNRKLITLACEQIVGMHKHEHYRDAVKDTSVPVLSERQRHRLFMEGILTGRSCQPGTREAGIPRLGEWTQWLLVVIQRLWPLREDRPAAVTEVYNKSACPIVISDE